MIGVIAVADGGRTLQNVGGQIEAMRLPDAHTCPLPFAAAEGMHSRTTVLTVELNAGRSPDFD